MGNKFKTLSKQSEGLFKEKGSKFIGYAFPIKSEVDAHDKIKQVGSEHSKSRHVCYAYRVGVSDPLERDSDAGEPSGTAGKPILGQVHSFELENVLVVVVRYFGGTLLGVSGLITAYKAAAKSAIENNKIIVKEKSWQFRLAFDYAQYHDIMHYINSEDFEISEQDMTNSCSMTVKVPEEKKVIFGQHLDNFENINYTCEALEY